MKVTTQTLPSYQIPRNNEEKPISIPKEKPQESRAKFHNQAFVELKNSNENIALIQKIQFSLGQIQKEIKDIQNDPQALQPSMQKIRDLQSKLTPILENAKKNKLTDFTFPANLTLDKLANLAQKLNNEQKNLNDKFKEITQKIQSFFASSQDFDLQEEMLKDPRFKEVHNPALFTPMAQELVL